MLTLYPGSKWFAGSLVAASFATHSLKDRPLGWLFLVTPVCCVFSLYGENLLFTIGAVAALALAVQSFRNLVLFAALSHAAYAWFFAPQIFFGHVLLAGFMLLPVFLSSKEQKGSAYAFSMITFFMINAAAYSVIGMFFLILLLILYGQINSRRKSRVAKEFLEKFPSRLFPYLKDPSIYFNHEHTALGIVWHNRYQIIRHEDLLEWTFSHQLNHLDEPMYTLEEGRRGIEFRLKLNQPLQAEVQLNFGKDIAAARRFEDSLVELKPGMEGRFVASTLPAVADDH